MTLDRWHAYNAASSAWYKAYKANLDIDVRSGRTTLIDSKVKTPPPPPPRAEVQTPRPSKNARWIPGYWFYEETKFHWIAPTEPQPTHTAVWTPGSWQWDGRVYVWVAGAWRIPPDAQHTWQRPTWNVNAGRARFVPGGWRVRVRLGR